MTRTLASLALICVVAVVSARPVVAALIVCGDADDNGSVTVTDGVQTLRAAADLSSVCTNAGCDMDGSGSITVSDGVNVLRKAAGLSSPDRCPVPASGPSSMDFTIGTGGGSCGQVAPGPMPATRLLSGGTALSCGGLAIGGGGSKVGEVPVPSGTTTRYRLTSCTDGVCMIKGMRDRDLPPGINGSSVGSATIEPSTFGAPIPIPNKDDPSNSGCIRVQFKEDASGSVDLATGVVALALKLNVTTWVTGDREEHCPICVVTETPAPGRPSSGTCDYGVSAGLPCTTVNPDGLSQDCLPCSGPESCPDPGDRTTRLNDFEIDLKQFGTDPVIQPVNDDFCPGPKIGCFGSQPEDIGVDPISHCTSITENGVPAPGLTEEAPAAVTLVSVFCLQAAGNVINLAASLPGPGALALEGTLTIHR